jgi:Fe2+ or Zn2+ uptake regulation protein
MVEFADQLRTAGLRVTRSRLAVLEEVRAHPRGDTGTILAAVRSGLPEVSRQAVYDVLHVLTEVGLVRRLQPSGSVARYEARVRDNDHRAVCCCGVIVDVECAVGDAPCLAASDPVGALNGFRFDEAEVIYFGLCANCATRALSAVVHGQYPVAPEQRGLA